MDNWMTCTRLIILLYCVLRYSRGNMEHIALVVLFMLLYISAATAYYLLKKFAVRSAFRVISLGVLTVASLYVNHLFILLIAVDIYELVSEYTDDWRVLPAFAIIPGFLCLGTNLILEYIAISLLSLLVFFIARNHFKTVGTLKKTNEELQDRIEDLAGKLNAGSEYEAQLRYLSQIEERNSLAQEIHDKVGHTLAGSIIQLEAAGMIINRDSEKAEDMVRNVTLNLKEGMEGIRSTLRSIKPASEQLGINRLKLILEEFTLNNRVKTTFAYEGRLDVITHMQWRIMTDNVKEALTNSLKYSNATMISTRLEVLNKIIKLEVRDDGEGAAAVKKGMGLSGMEERTGAAGGKLVIDGSDGFSVITLLPVEASGQK